jgi:ABC-type cobalamin/Fe3+-siderophores transport system ATPase subunit
MQAVLEVKDLRAGYAEREILKGVSFTLGPDDFFAIIGPSGAGKSTLIRCVNRLVEPRAARCCSTASTCSSSPIPRCGCSAATSA